MRERVLKAILIIVGLLFLAGIYPLTMFSGRDPALAMMLSLYVTLGVFLLLAARNPSANRNLIAFTAWSSFAHASLMAAQAYRKVIERGELAGVVGLVVIGVLLIVFAPGNKDRTANLRGYRLSTVRSPISCFPGVGVCLLTGGWCSLDWLRLSGCPCFPEYIPSFPVAAFA